MSQGDRAVVRVAGLERHFGPLRALDGIDLEVAHGELFGLVGPDGAGKTTLLRILSGVLRPSGGTVQVMDADMASDPEAAKPHLAYMAQRFGLYEDLTVQENLEFYADLFGVPPSSRAQREERLFQFSGLGPFRDRLAGALSGGMKQKLGLSCALIHQPRLLLLDEPTFGVDPISRRDLWLILHEMVADGITIVVSTAYMDEAERCDRVALLHQGRVLDLDTPTRLQDRLEGRVLSLQVTDPRGVRDRLRAEGIPCALFGETLHVEMPHPSFRESVEAHLRRTGVTRFKAEPVRASLEDVFVHRVRKEAGDD